MDTLPCRDSPHPRDTLMTFENLPKKRKSPGRVMVPSVVRPDVLYTPLNTGKTRTKAKQQQPQARIQPPEELPRRGRGRPSVTIASGMTQNTFVKKCKALDRAINQLKKSMFHDYSVRRSLVEYDAIDPDLFQSWHLSRLDQRTQTLVKVGENAVALVDSYPATAPERVTLRQQLSQSMLFVVCFISLLTTRYQAVRSEGSVWCLSSASS